MVKLRNALCPACGADVSVTYWPFSVPLYTIHVIRGSQRDCGNSLRPVEVRPENDRLRPA